MQQPNGAAATFDLSAAIADFVADPARTALELPKGLTAEQRKQAKRLADEHGGLKCESFGFGSDRQMHLFKKETSEPAVRVKNTFIDDWVVSEPSAEEPPHCRSLPPGMFTRLPEREDERLALSPVVEGSPSSRASFGDLSAMARNSHPSDFGFAAPLPELPELGEGTRFASAHLEQQPNEGSFQPCLDAERAKSPPAVAAPPPIDEDSALETYTVGSEVIIDGLSKLPDFNGRAGVVQSYDAASGRYNVLLDTPVNNGTRMAKVKFENLRSKLPPPPYFAPTLLSQQNALATGLGGIGVRNAVPVEAFSTHPATGMMVKPLKLDGLV